MTQHINLEERIKIKALHDQGLNAPVIAKYLKRHKTSIYRELSKRTDSGVYDHQYAQQLSSSNMARYRHQGPDDKTISIIEKRLLMSNGVPNKYRDGSE